LPQGDEDAQPLIDALRVHGVRAENAVWDDAAVDWSRFDLVVVRSAWDYAERRDSFLSWARSVPRVLNAVEVLEWNTDKQRYLTDLAQAGVSVVPTMFVAPGELFEAPGEPFVVKPAISAGGRSSARFEDGEVDAARALIARIHGDGRVAMVQPFLGDIEETAVVYLDGAYSHALRRRVPLPSAAADVLYLEEELAAAQPGRRERAVADAALAAAPSDLLYARVDVAEGMVIELELAEPSLYLAFGEGAAERFAAAINQRLRISPEKGRTTSQ
jgi:glutathione synthase/RimK-type ligase-like ATP-grasp enzyme